MSSVRFRCVLGAAAVLIALTAAAPAGAAVSVSTVSGRLVVVDSDGQMPVANTVVVACAALGGQLTTKVGMAAPVAHGACSSFTGIDIDMSRGDDVVDTSGVDGLATRGLVTINVTLGRAPNPFETASDENTFTGGPLGERVDGGGTVNAGGGNDTVDASRGGAVNGGPGTDSLVLAGSTVLNETAYSRPGGLFGFFFWDQSGFESATLTGDETANFLNASFFPGRATISGGGGDDTIATSPSGDVSGGTGSDTVTLSGSDLTVTSTEVSGDQPRGLTEVEALVWTGGAGNDRFDTFGRHFLASVTASGGAGDDLLRIFGAAATVRGDDGDDRIELRSGVVDAAGGAGTDTIVTGNGILGGAYTLTSATGGDDTLTQFEAAILSGSFTDDQFVTAAFPGAVTLDTEGGNDTITTGPGSDRITAGPGNDTVTVGAGNDTADGGEGADTVSYPGGIPVTVDLAGGRSGATDESDTLTGFETGVGGNGGDHLRGTANADTLLGGAGRDRLDGAGGPDLLDGQAGADVVTGGPGGPGDNDVLLGGPGFDLLTYAGRTTPVRVTLDGKPDDGSAGEGDQADPSFEGLVGGSGDDFLFGPTTVAPAERPAAALSGPRNTAVRLIAGGPGNDRITGTAGPDAASGGPGKDTVDTGAGPDAVNGGSGDDKLLGGSGNDRVRGARGVDAFSLGPGRDVAFSTDSAKEELDCGEGKDQGYTNAGDEPETDCDSVAGTTKTAATAPGSAPDGTDDTCSDGDDIFGSLGDEDFAGEAAQDRLFSCLKITDSSEVEFFSDEFDEDLYGFGDDDFGDPFGEDLGGKLPPAPALKTKILVAVKNAYSVKVTCPRKADRRCIGELIASTPAGKQVASGLFGINKGKTATVRLRIPAKSRRPARAAKRLDLTLEGRDRGSDLWQFTKSLKVTKPRAVPTRPKVAPR